MLKPIMQIGSRWSHIQEHPKDAVLVTTSGMPLLLLSLVSVGLADLKVIVRMISGGCKSDN